MFKHIVLVEILVHLRKKEKPFDYIDTHAGAGLYDLRSEHANKLKEHALGIGSLSPEDWPELSAYFEVIQAYNESKSLIFYPGSPLIAIHFLRRQDRAWLYELHPTDFELLGHNTRKRPREEYYARTDSRDCFHYCPLYPEEAWY
jgi:23S rRNA (adenine2030-N6)-methyltransferase